jgi:regulator of protease activity HflC (stomatin/prohibitin superfamily)
MSAQFRQDERRAFDSIHALGSPAQMPSEAQKVITERLWAIERQRQEIIESESERGKQLTPASAEKLRNQLQLEASYLYTLAERYNQRG